MWPVISAVTELLDKVTDSDVHCEVVISPTCVASPFKGDFSYSRARADKISTDLGRRAVPLR